MIEHSEISDDREQQPYAMIAEYHRLKENDQAADQTDFSARFAASGGTY